jgi:ATP-dependent RNA helicase DDX41
MLFFFALWGWKKMRSHSKLSCLIAAAPQVEETSLLDLKALLIEAKQRVPPVLQAIQDPFADDGGAAGSGKAVGGVRGCAFCGGLGHRIADCPKRDKDARRLGSGQRDMLVGGGGYGGET